MVGCVQYRWVFIILLGVIFARVFEVMAAGGPVLNSTGEFRQRPGWRNAARDLCALTQPDVCCASRDFRRHTTHYRVSAKVSF